MLTKEQQEKILRFDGWEYRECNPNHPQLKNTLHGMGWFHKNHTEGYANMPDLSDLNLLMEIIENKTHSYNIVHNSLEHWCNINTLKGNNQGLNSYHGNGKTLIDALHEALLKLSEAQT